MRYFCAVAERLSFTEAARALHVSQSAVSGQVRDLEAEIGVPLLVRNQHAVSLTPQGALFAEDAREILAKADQAVVRALRAAKGQVGSLSVGLCGPATSAFLPRLIREFRNRFPGVSVSLREVSPAAQLEALETGQLTVGFTRGVPRVKRDRLQSSLLYREPLLVVLAKDHPLAGKGPVAMQDLAAERFVLYHREGAPQLFDLIVSMCRKAKFSPEIVNAPEQMQTVVTLVEAGEGVAIVPACLWMLRTEGVQLEGLTPESPLTDVVIAWRAQGEEPVRQAFLDLVREHKEEIQRVMAQQGGGVTRGGAADYASK